MHNEFTAIVEQDGPWHIAYCAEVPGANGQGKSREECLASLREAISLILDYRREQSLCPSMDGPLCYSPMTTRPAALPRKRRARTPERFPG